MVFGVVGDEGSNNARRVTVPTELVEDITAGVSKHGFYTALVADADGDNGIHRGFLPFFE
jgi:hypothetical protein